MKMRKVFLTVACFIAIGPTHAEPSLASIRDFARTLWVSQECHLNGPEGELLDIKLNSDQIIIDIGLPPPKTPNGSSTMQP
jgi:hypothetical protein